jgi:hypothetical protein
MKTQNNTTLKVLTAFLGVFIILFFFFIIGNNNKEQIIYVPQEINEISFEEEFKAEFIKGCTDNDKDMLGFCDCAYEESLEHYGFDGFVDVSIEYARTYLMPSKFLDIAESCL